MNNGWSLRSGSYEDSNPIGKQIQTFIETYCEYTIYLRRDNRFPCPDHWDQATETVKINDGTCPFCWGFGVKVTPQIVPSRISRGDAELRNMIGDMKMEPGYLDHYKEIIHFPRAVYPALNDLILCCEWNKPTQEITIPPVGRPLLVTSIYLVKSLNLHFMRELGWISCGVESLLIDKDHISKLIPRLNKLSVPDTSWRQRSWWN